MVCDTKSGRYSTDLDVYNYTSKKQQASVHAKRYNEEIMSPGCFLLFIWVYMPNICLHSLVDLVLASHSQVQGK